MYFRSQIWHQRSRTQLHIQPEMVVINLKIFTNTKSQEAYRKSAQFSSNRQSSNSCNQKFFYGRIRTKTGDWNRRSGKKSASTLGGRERPGKTNPMLQTETRWEKDFTRNLAVKSTLLCLLSTNPHHRSSSLHTLPLYLSSSAQIWW